MRNCDKKKVWAVATISAAVIMGGYGLYATFRGGRLQ